MFLVCGQVALVCEGLEAIIFRNLRLMAACHHWGLGLIAGETPSSPLVYLYLVISVSDE